MTTELYVRDGSRFVRVDDARPARRLPPIPTPVPVPDDGPAVISIPRGDGSYAVHAPRCPHGHFARYAAAHCRRCRTPR